MAQNIWNETTINKLKKLVSENFSSREIADIFGVTKNAIIGKCRRENIKLKNRRNGTKQELKSVPTLATLPIQKPLIRFKRKRSLHSVTKVRLHKRVKVKAGEFDYRKSIKVDMLEAYEKLKVQPIPENGHCKYIHGDVRNGNYNWCGKPTKDNKSYCTEHHAVVYVEDYRSKDKNKPKRFQL